MYAVSDELSSARHKHAEFISQLSEYERVIEEHRRDLVTEQSRHDDTEHRQRTLDVQVRAC